jgi:molecular chaperone GrpE
MEQDFRDLLADVERQRDEYLDLAKRTKADFENYRKRVVGEAAGAEARGRADVVRQLLPVLDNLERALEAIAVHPEEDARVSGETAAGSSLVEGIRLVYEELKGILKRSGVESYEPQGESFDPLWHEAMMARPVPPDEAGIVLEVLEKGYRQNGQVLRPARVVVGKEEEEAAAPAGDEPAT